MITKLKSRLIYSFLLGVLMKQKIISIISFFLIVCILSVSLSSNVYAEDLPENPYTLTDSELNEVLNDLGINKPTLTVDKFLQYIFMQQNAIVDGDIQTVLKNDDWFKSNFNKDNFKGALTKTSDGFTIKADFVNNLLGSLKNGTKQKYGYSYIHTVPKSAFVLSHFESTVFYNSFKNLMNKSNGVALCAVDGSYADGYHFRMVKLPKVNEFVVIFGSISSQGEREWNTYKVYDLTGKLIDYSYPYARSNGKYDDFVYVDKDLYQLDTSFDDFNEFSYRQYNDLDRGGMQYGRQYLVTDTPMTIPYFKTLNAYQNYLMDKGGYYVGSNFKDTIDTDITITPDMLNNIDKYLKDYDSLLKQIQDLLNNELDFEKVQQLIDDYLKKMSESLDDIEQEQEQANTWLEKIYNAIIDLPNKITHNDNNSNDIDLTELNKSLTTVINKLDSINSKLNNIDTDNDNEKLTDIETSITDNKIVLNGIKTELASQSADIKEITTQLQSVADSLKDLSSDVSTINTELTDMSNQLDNISKNLKDLAVTLENIENELKDTNGLLEKIANKLTDMKTEFNAHFVTIENFLSSISGKITTDTILDTFDNLVDDVKEETEKSIFEYIKMIFDFFHEIAEALEKRFPFSLPWDIAFILAFLADNPVPPVFEFPLVIESWGIKEVLTIDLSALQKVSDVSRLLLTMLFSLYLGKLTYNVIKIKQGDSN